jgi:hypothetical protein
VARAGPAGGDATLAAALRVRPRLTAAVLLAGAILGGALPLVVPATVTASQVVLLSDRDDVSGDIVDAKVAASVLRRPAALEAAAAAMEAVTGASPRLADVRRALRLDTDRHLSRLTVAFTNGRPAVARAAVASAVATLTRFRSQRVQVVTTIALQQLDAFEQRTLPNLTGRRREDAARQVGQRRARLLLARATVDQLVTGRLSVRSDSPVNPVLALVTGPLAALPLALLLGHRAAVRASKVTTVDAARAALGRPLTVTVTGHGSRRLSARGSATRQAWAEASVTLFGADARTVAIASASDADEDGLTALAELARVALHHNRPVAVACSRPSALLRLLGPREGRFRLWRIAEVPAVRRPGELLLVDLTDALDSSGALSGAHLVTEAVVVVRTGAPVADLERLVALLATLHIACTGCIVLMSGGQPGLRRRRDPGRRRTGVRRTPLRPAAGLQRGGSG